MSAYRLTLAWRNLTRHRTRTAVSLSAIAFGVVALLIAGGFIEWMFWAMRETAIVQTGIGHIQISRPGFRSAGQADPGAFLLPADATKLNEIRTSPNVNAVSERLLLHGLASSGEKTIVFSGEAVDADTDKTIRRTLLVAGEDLAKEDPTGVLLGRGLAAALGVRTGDRISLVVSLPGGGINAVEGRLRGTFTVHIKEFDDAAVRMPIELGRELLRAPTAHAWVVGLARTEQTDEAMAYLRALLPADRFELASWVDLSDFYRKAVVLLSRQVYFVGFLIGLIILLCISNSLTMNVLERTGEIGTLMAIGTPRTRVLQLFLLEGMLLGLIGGLAGLAIGWLLAQALSFIGIPMPPPPGRSEAYSAEIILTVPLAFAAFAMAVISTMLAGLYPAWKASRLPIVDALRHNV
jgi:putative ABC transport system permease protein